MLDTDPDNYGIYAGDGVPDWWQVTYFGTNNPSGVASATNCTGQNNLDTYTADLNPTDPASRFLVVAASSLPPDEWVYFPSSTNRLYTLLWSTDLVAGAWTPVPDATPVKGNGDIFCLGDTNAAFPLFHRVKVQVP